MLTKLIGGCLILLGGTCLGFLKSSELSRREKSLRDIKTALSILESEIVLSSNHLKDAFLKISRLCACRGLFSDAAKTMGDCGIDRAWQDAVEQNKKGLCLSESDAEILKILSSRLGMSDKEQQKKNIRHVETLLDMAITNAHAEYQNSAKLYRSMGFLGGLFVVMLLF